MKRGVAALRLPPPFPFHLTVQRGNDPCRVGHPLGRQMVVGAVQAGLAPKGILQFRDDGDAEVFPEIGVQFCPCRRKSSRDSVS